MRRRAELAAFRRHRPRRDQDIDHQVDHQRRGQEIEHDRGDDDVAAAIGLQPGRHQCPCRAEAHPGEQRQRQQRRERQMPVACQQYQSDAETAEVACPSPPMLNNPA